MNFNKFTIKSQEALEKAKEIAENYSNQAIENRHILAALIQEDGFVTDLINKISPDIKIIKIKISELLDKLPKVSGGEVYLSRTVNNTLKNAKEEAKNLQDEYLSVEHILLAISESKSESSKLLSNYGIKKNSIFSALKDIRGNKTVKSQNPEEEYQALSQYGRILNQEVKAGKIDPVIGREEEIRRVLQVLSRRTKNNPVLIGDPGVGKTAVVEGIAQRIVAENVPENMKSKTIVSLDLASLLAGTSMRGQFEQRLKAVIKDVADSEGEIILFIDEIHTLIGTGSVGGTMDAANILKPALARGELHCVGATTLGEYQKHIEKDPALERRFQKVLIEESTVEDTISILRGLKDKYEIHHGVKISDSAIVAAAELSKRYLPDRFLPDKAIDLIDEAASKIRIEINSMPDELNAIEQRIRQLEIEREALNRELKDNI